MLFKYCTANAIGKLYNDKAALALVCSQSYGDKKCTEHKKLYEVLMDNCTNLKNSVDTTVNKTRVLKRVLAIEFVILFNSLHYKSNKVFRWKDGLLCNTGEAACTTGCR